MVSLDLLGKIESRLRQAKGSRDVYFGGINVILVRDPGQLLAIGGTPLYGHSDKPFCLQGEIAYAIFNKVVILDQVVRQQEDLSDPLQAQFLYILKDLHDGIVFKSQWEILMTLSPSNIGVTFEEDLRML